MKYSVVALALVAAAQAQTRNDIPECALPCLDKAIESQTSCNVRDYPCVCKNFSKVRGIATTCVIEKCGADVAINKVLPGTEALCKNPKDESGGSSGGSSAAAAATVTSSSTTEAAETTSEPETVAATTTSTTPAPVPEASTTVVVQPPITPNATTGAPTQSTSAVVTGNGAAALTGLGGIAMLAFAALAL